MRESVIRGTAVSFSINAREAVSGGPWPITSATRKAEAGSSQVQDLLGLRFSEGIQVQAQELNESLERSGRAARQLRVCTVLADPELGA